MATHNLPHAATPFVNRVSEIGEIAHRLNSAECRLLTLVGPGGIGKTRLAVRVAAGCDDQFDDGVYFVPLHALDSSEFIVSTIADVVGFQFRPGEDPKQQLLQYLREKALLLVLDNFEHLLDGADLLAELMAASPDLKLLVTSREALNLQEEWRLPVSGLRYPETTSVDEPGSYGAIQLFVERARQARGDLSLVDEQTAVVRVCQLVEGMPLALELAAVWAKALGTDEIAVEIQRNLDFLSTSMRNIPQRHRSIQAVFEQTWRQLSDEEQRVFRALAVFRGGFRREAAEAVTSISLRVLFNLIDKSLLTREPNGRYQIHELLRQYAEGQLETTPEEATRIREEHVAYYTDVLHERGQDIHGVRRFDVARELEAEIDNIRVAWSWAIEHSMIEAIDRVEYTLFGFYSLRNRYLEGTNAFEKAARMPDNGDPRTDICLAKVHYSLGWMYVIRGAFETAQAALERSWLLYSRHDTLPAPERGYDPRILLGETYLRLGKYSEAEILCQDAIRDYTLRDAPLNRASAWYVLSQVARVQGKYRDARDFIRQGYAAVTTVTEPEEPNTLSGMLYHLGQIALDEGEHTEAKHCFERVREISIKLEHLYGVITALIGMGNIAIAQAHYGEARRYLREALQLNREGMLLVPPIYLGIGELFLQIGRKARGIELLTFSLHHPAGDFETKVRAQRLLARDQSTLTAAQQASAQVDFEAVTRALLDELQRADDTTITHQTPAADETLVDPLSERELEILALVAAGRTNREIAQQLFLVVGTVKWYLTNIYSKLGVQNRTLAIARARQLNLLP